MTAYSTARDGAGCRIEPSQLKNGQIPSEISNIIDIRRQTLDHSILEYIKKGLRQPGEKTLPTLLLYDAAGLKLFEKITYLDEYYLTNAEIDVLSNYADEIAKRIRPGGIVVELGSG
jgi:L-histidine Nalpha-methyltransferase / hercynylcysteine S-oxide synthase